MVKKHVDAINAWNGIMHNERYVWKACIDNILMRYVYVWLKAYVRGSMHEIMYDYEM